MVAPVPAERVGPAARTARLDAWLAIKKSFAFALVTDDYEAAWLDRLSKLAKRIRDLTAQDPDLALYLMLQTAMNEADHYSAHHALFCAVVADLCAAHFEWPEAEAVAVHNAALTMNVGMGPMQNAMAQQSGPLSPAQRLRVEDHPTKSVEQLKVAGVDDPIWLEVVRRHHRPIDEGESADPLTPPQRLAQLLQRIDVFTAKLSRRKTRPGSSATVAARDACLNACGLPDATGATMLRVLGLYPPGSFVRLAGGEVGVVVRRGEKAHTPFVACVRRPDGGVINQPVLRDTSSRLHAVQRSLSADDAKIRLDHERVLGARG
ncbi:MAG TPA: hypothetical protein VIO33_05595 [Burkholderiaceae bacterium]